MRVALLIIKEGAICLLFLDRVGSRWLEWDDMRLLINLLLINKGTIGEVIKRRMMLCV